MSAKCSTFEVGNILVTLIGLVLLLDLELVGEPLISLSSSQFLVLGISLQPSLRCSVQFYHGLPELGEL